MNRITLIVFFTFSSFYSFCRPTIISGKFNFQDSRIKEIRLNRFNFLLQKTETLTTSELKKDSTFTLVLKIEEPVVASILNNDFFITPGDSVYIIFNSPRSLDIQGQNAGNYLFIPYIKNVDSPLRNLKSYKDFSAYRAALKQYISAREEYLNKLKLMTPVSEKFESFFQKENLYRYYYDLLQFDPNSPQQYQEILKEIKDEDLRSDFFISNYYSMFLQKYLQMSVKAMEIKGKNAFFDLTNLKLIGKEREAMYFFEFCILANNGSKTDKPLLDSILIIYNSLFRPAQFSKEMEACYKKFNNNLRKIPESVLEDTVINAEGKRKTLNALLNEYHGHWIYVDMWASWCGPCITEIPKSVQLKEQLQNDKLVFLYLSIDDDPEKWKNLIKEKHYDKWADSYLLERGTKSNWVKHFNIESIPRYILLGQKAETLSFNAISPSSPEVKDLILDNMR